MKGKIFQKIVLCSAIFVAISGFFITKNKEVYAEEGLVKVIVKNDPVKVETEGIENESVLEVSEEIPEVKIDYKNSKQIRIVLTDPDGNIIFEKEYKVDYSPDSNDLSVKFDDDIFSKFGKYTLQIFATGTDGEEVEASTTVFYIEETVSTPNTGASNALDSEAMQTGLTFVLIVSGLLIVAAVIRFFKKGAKRER